MKDDIKTLLSQLTQAEKAMLCSGTDFWRLPAVERLDLPSIMVTDGPHGLRKQPDGADHLGINESVPATCFPTASGLAASWNRELVQAVGIALGEECQAENVSVILGPGVNIKRNPLGGRNFEYFSEDPYLSGEMAVAWIDGVQSQGIGASLKHYAVNNHEAGRMVVDAIVDERTLREIYLPGFEVAVKKARPWTVMCAYNKLNGIYLSENEKMLTDILRDEWQFDGLVVTDWGAANDRVKGVKAGLDLEMPSSGNINTDRIIAAIEQGELKIEELDRCVERVLSLILKAKDGLNRTAIHSMDDHHSLAKRAATEACVLLKNTDAFLPFNVQDSVAVIGALAVNTRYQGSGSSQINPTQLEQPLDTISHLVEGEQVAFAAGYTLAGQASETLISEALLVAEAADKIIVIVGLTPDYESEGFDRSHLDLPAGQIDLLLALKPFHDKVALVLQNGAPVVLPHLNVPSILEVYLGGQAGASAMADVLFGVANPSGKLAETFPLNLNDIPSQPWFPGETRQSQYRESIWVGYRYFSTTNKPVAYPFGHGLSYTSFDYTDLKISKADVDPGVGSIRFGRQEKITVSLTVKNTGQLFGAEVVQLYIGQKNASVHRPAKELKSFTKIWLAPGEETQLVMVLDYRSFSFWDKQQKTWVAESDGYTVFVGASVEDIRLSQDVVIETEHALETPDPSLASYFSPATLDFDDATFASLLGGAIPQAVPTKPFQLNSTLLEVESTWIGKQLRKQVNKMVKEVVGDVSDHDRLMIEVITAEMPLRNMVTNSQGKLSTKLMGRMIHLMNRDWLKFIVGAPIRSE